MQKLSKKTEHFTDSVIRRMTRIAYQYDSINLSQGFPDFAPPEMLLKRLGETAGMPDVHQYSITFGDPGFRRALAEKQSRFMGIDIDPDTEITVTCGSTEAMMSSVLTVADPGDKVIIFSPFYENYGADTILSGAEPIYVPLVPPDFHFDPEVLEDAFRQHPKAMILCNPSNPTGKVFTREELELIASLAIKYDTYVITDEVYEHLVYAPYTHVAAASLPGLFDHVITCNSLSKTYAVTGWRLGYVIAPEEVAEAAKKVHDFLTVGAPAPLQEAAVVGLNFPESYYEELRALYTDKRDHFLAGLDSIGLKHNVPRGSYFVMVDISDFLALPAFKGMTDLEFCEWMIKNIGVAAVPGSSFFREEVNDLIRLHFAREKETLDEVIVRLGKMTALLNGQGS